MDGASTFQTKLSNKIIPARIFPSACILDLVTNYDSPQLIRALSNGIRGMILYYNEIYFFFRNFKNQTIVSKVFIQCNFFSEAASIKKKNHHLFWYRTEAIIHFDHNGIMVTADFIVLWSEKKHAAEFLIQKVKRSVP